MDNFNKDIELENITRKIMNEFAKTIELFGLTPLEARLFTYLYLADEALTLDEMGEALGKSKTAMSTNIRSLLKLNLVRRVWRKGVRKDLYEANPQLFKTFINNYLNNWIDATGSQKLALLEIKHLVEAGNKEGNEDEWIRLKNQMNDILAFHDRLEALFKEIKQ